MRDRVVLIVSLVTLVGLAAAFALSAFGGASPEKTLVASAQKMAAQQTMTGRISATVTMGGTPFMTMNGTMSSDLANSVHTSSLNMDIMSLVSIQMNEVSTATSSVVQLPTLGPTWYMSGDGDAASSASDAAADAMTDQRAWMKRLSDTGSVTKVGSEQIGGRTVDHLRVTLDGTALAGATDIAARTSSDTKLSDVTADVWCDPETDLPVREDVNFTMTTKGKTLSMKLSMTDLQFGVLVNIQVPDPASVRPESEMETAMRSIG